MCCAGGRKFKGMANGKKIVLMQTAEEVCALRLQPMQRGWGASAVERCADLADEEGTLRDFRGMCGGGDLTLALRTSSVLLKVLRLPAAAKEALASAVELQMDRFSPFSGEEQTIAHEVLEEGAEELTVLAASVPTTLFETWDAILKQLHAALPVRVDLAVLGAWHQLRTRHAELFGGAARKLLLVELDGEWNVMLVENGAPRFIRSLAPATEGDWKRDLNLSLLSAEAEVGAGHVDEVVVFAGNAHGPSDSVLNEVCECTVRRLNVKGIDDALEGAARRSLEKKTLNLLPATWALARKEKAVHRQFVWGVGAAAILWVAIVLVLFGGPYVTGLMLKSREAASKALDPAYKVVYDLRERVRLINRYKDRSNSALDALYVVTKAMPEGLTLTQLNYQRLDGVKINGEASGDLNAVYALQNALQVTPPFRESKLGAIVSSPNRASRFEIDAYFEPQEAKK